MSSRPAHRHGSRPTVVFAPCVRWTDHQGTDHRLATELSRSVDVVWVEPPEPAFPRPVRELKSALRADVDEVSKGIWRVRTPSPPGWSKAPMRPLVLRLHRHRLGRAFRALGGRADAAITTNGLIPVSWLPGATKCFYCTDDFQSGAQFYGVDQRLVLRGVRREVAEAQVVAAVSEPIATSLSRLGNGRPVEVIPNGCDPHFVAPVTVETQGVPQAGVFGTLNDRIDFDLLGSVLDAGIHLLLVGPIAAGLSARSDVLRVVHHPNSEYVGSVPYAEMPKYLSRITIGLTPYTQSAFNEASFPLKTLEYLAAGVPVVSTDLPASRWLNSDLVATCSSPQSFVECTRRLLADGRSPSLAHRCTELASLHTWEKRARRLLQLLGFEHATEADASPT